jgi:excisionase family DNA binding protein
MLDQHFELMRELIDEVRLLRHEVEHTSDNGRSSDRPLTREEAAEYLGIHKDTLYRWAVEEGRISYCRLGEGSRASLRFLRKNLDDFLSSQRIPTVEETRQKRAL